MSLDHSGMKQAILRLQRAATTVPVAVDASLREAAYQARNVARDMAPIDYGELREAVVVRRLGVQGPKGRFISGQSIYEVYIDGKRPVKDPEKLADGITTVGDYAYEVHEHMGYGNKKSYLMPSARSVAAGRAAGVEAGGKFIPRALLHLNGVNSGLLVAKLARASSKAIKSLDK